MSEPTRDQMIVQPDGASRDAEIARWLWMLEDTRRETEKVLRDLDDAAMDWKPDWALHSVGTLLYHIPMVEYDWLYVEVMEHSPDDDYPAAMLALFPHPMRTDGALTRVSGVSLADHRARMAAVRDALLDVYRAMSLEDFRRVRAFPDYDVTPEWVLHHLYQHEAEHRAELAALRTGYHKFQSE